MNIQDTLDPLVTYVPNSVIYEGIAVPDDVEGTPFPLDGDGIVSLTNMERRGGSHYIEFEVIIHAGEEMNAAVKIVNTGVVRASGMTAPFEHIQWLPLMERVYTLPPTDPPTTEDEEVDDFLCPEEL